MELGWGGLRDGAEAPRLTAACWPWPRGRWLVASSPVTESAIQRAGEAGGVVSLERDDVSSAVGVRMACLPFHAEEFVDEADKRLRRSRG